MYTQSRKYTSAKKTKYGDSVYDSKFEAGVAQELTFRQAAGELLSFEKQVRIPLVVNGYQIADYYIDFVAYRKDGVTEYIEAKGWPTPIWRMKWAIFEALYSDLADVELRVIWQGKRKRLRKIKKYV